MVNSIQALKQRLKECDFALLRPDEVDFILKLSGPLRLLELEENRSDVNASLVTKMREALDRSQILSLLEIFLEERHAEASPPTLSDLDERERIKRIYVALDCFYADYYPERFGNVEAESQPPARILPDGEEYDFFALKQSIDLVLDRVVRSHQQWRLKSSLSGLQAFFEVYLDVSPTVDIFLLVEPLRECVKFASDLLNGSRSSISVDDIVDQHFQIYLAKREMRRIGVC